MSIGLLRNISFANMEDCILKQWNSGRYTDLPRLPELAHMHRNHSAGQRMSQGLCPWSCPMPFRQNQDAS